MIDLGVVKDNLDAIQYATYCAAKVNKIEDKLGSIEIGKDADLIIVEGNPDKNIINENDYKKLISEIKILPSLIKKSKVKDLL